MEITREWLVAERQSMECEDRMDDVAIVDLALEALARRDADAGAVMVEGWTFSGWSADPVPSLYGFTTGAKPTSGCPVPVTVTIRRRAEKGE